MSTANKILWGMTIFALITGVWPVAIIGLIMSITTTMNESEKTKQQRQKAKHKREVEQKELDMVRKSNEILLHLIQDEHREERDR